MIGKPHTVPGKVNGKAGSVRVRLIPAPRGSGIVAAPAAKRLLNFAGVEDVYTRTRGATATLGNFAKATFNALSKTYGYLTPDLWKEYALHQTVFQENALYLASTSDKKGDSF